MKSRDGKSQRREEQKREDKRRESVGGKKMQVGERVGKSRNTVFFQWFVAPEGRKVGSLKRRVRSNLARWEMKNCTPLWREAHLEVKTYKAHSCSDDFWKLRCRKSARRCGAKHISKSKCTKHTMFGPLLEVDMSKKCTPLWREAHFKVKSVKNWWSRSTFGSWHVEIVHAVVARSTFRSFKNHMSGPLLDVQMSFRVAGIRDCATLSKVSKTWGFCSISQNDGRRGTFEEDLERCISRGRRSTRDMFIRDVRRSGRWFPERGCILEHQIFSFGKMILRDRCSTSYDLASLFRGRRSTLDRVSGKIAKRIGTRPSALHSIFHFWRKSRRIVSFLMLSSSTIEEVSQNSFVFKFAERQIDR